MAYELPPLPYAFDALEPPIDARTVEIHYTKHHKTYLDNLNKALEAHPDLSRKPIDELLRDLSQIPENIRQTVINNGGGYANHNLYWEVMGPKKGGEPRGQLANAINDAFGGFAKFKEQFSQAALTRFGSGYAWLTFDPNGKLTITQTLNQDSVVSIGHKPILIIDVWEHAYYLNYQNRRADYIAAWWNVVNWDAAEQRYRAAKR
ncbi:MAG TPA: superoxide dismutase [Phycisphaerae bacterium]|jgi:Fe-Mn family superoxide dismutase|nr:superoxide dismutase [Phycisphaerae bacterium]HPC21256.1 superoxide dismutase [Phycisphaerae bacterium]HRS27692.1 superoxide dismutase [Phycisphaerae bacterium]HRT40857.1 superoxide dismutase [Phycisphaerae bacterium]